MTDPNRAAADPALGDSPLLPGAEGWVAPLVMPVAADVDAASGAEVRIEERLSPRVMPCWWIGGLFGLAVVAAVAVGALSILGERLPFDPATRRVLLIVAGSMALAWTLVAPLLAWRRWRFSVGETMLWARHGIVIHEEKTIPINRLQHVDLTRGPLERAFGLATLIVFTAGSETATFRLPGLPAQRAGQLRDAVLAARGEDVI